MNAIPLLSKESTLLSTITFTEVLYLYLLSIAKVERASLVAELSVSDLEDRFQLWGEEAIDVALDDLEKMEIVSIKLGKIKLGNVSEGNKKLFTGNTSDLTTYYEPILKHADAFVKSSGSSVRKSMATTVKTTLLEFQQKPAEKYGIRDFVFLFRASYEAIHQEYHREFQEKEFGQMKNLTKLYDNITLQQMILFYANSYEKWSKVLTIPGLLMNKDEIFSAVKGKVTKRKLREGDYESGF